MQKRGANFKYFEHEGGGGGVGGRGGRNPVKKSLC